MRDKQFGRLIPALLMALGFTIISSMLPAGQLREAAAASTLLEAAKPPAFKDTAGHWGAAAIQWAVESGIVSGYADGTFKPDKTVSEPEFLSMLLRAYPGIKLPAAEPGAPWHAPYYAYAAEQSWPLVESADPQDFTRGSVASIIAATQGTAGGEREAIAYLLDRKLANGKTSNTIAGFEASSSLKRVEALQFIKNMADQRLTINNVSSVEPAPAAAQAERERFAVSGIEIGDTEASVLAQHGQPARKDASEYGFQWYIYNQDYADYVQVGIQKGRVVGLFTNAANWSSTDGIQSGTAAADVRKAFGKPVELIKSNTIVTVNGDEANLFLVDDKYYATVFFDKHDKDRATAIQLIDKAVETAQTRPYPAFNEALRSAYERQIHDLANVSRARSGLAPLAWHDGIAATARKHSKDMADRDYFDHDNPDGLSPFDRMDADRIAYRAAAENIAAGQTNAIFAHAGWMNSRGHRVNILDADLQRLGVGVHFGGDYRLYYTQNFYTPM
jgi:uncharacterized protein YkwD